MPRLKETEEKKRVPELTFEDTKDLVKYIGKIKNIESEDYILTLYKKGVIYRRLRRVGITDDVESKEINYREIL
jgi:hypothetical protein